MKTSADESLPTRPIIAIGMVSLWAKALQAAAGILLAYTFGASHATDAYVAAKSLIIGIYLIADSPIYHALVPLWSLRDINTPSARRFLGASLLATGITAFILAVLLLFFAPVVLHALLPGGSPETLAEATSLCRLMACAVLLALPISLLKAFNASRKRYFCAAVDGPSMHLVLILILLFVPTTWGLRPAAMAIPIAFCLLGMLQMYVARREFHPQFHGKSPEAFGEFIRLLLPILGLNLLLQGNLFFMNAMASYTGESAVSCLLYSYTMAQAPVSLIDLVLFSALFPFAARLSGNGAFVAFRETFHTVLKGIVLFLLPLNLWMIMSRTDLIALVLEHGRFDAEDTRLTAICFLGHSLAILPWAIEAFAYRCLFALKRPNDYLWIVLLRVGGTVGGCLLLVPPLGLLGVVVSFALGLGISALLCCIRVERMLHTQHNLTPNRSQGYLHHLGYLGLVLALLAGTTVVIGVLRTVLAESGLLFRLASTAFPCLILSLGIVVAWSKHRVRTSS